MGLLSDQAVECGHELTVTYSEDSLPLEVAARHLFEDSHHFFGAFVSLWNRFWLFESAPAFCFRDRSILRNFNLWHEFSNVFSIKA